MRELSSGSLPVVCVFGGHRRLCRVGGRGGFGLLGGGEVGAADPDHGEVDDQGEQRDPGGGQEPAAEPGGEGVVVDRGGLRAARGGRVPGPRGGGGLGVDAVGDDGPGDGAEDRQADGAAELLAGVEQAGGHPGVGFGDAVQRDQGQRDEQQGGAGADDQGRAEHRAGVGVVLADPGQPVQAAGAGRGAGDQDRAGADLGHELGDGPGSDEQGGGEREVGEAGFQGGVSPGGLHEHGEEEEHAEDEDAHPGVAEVGAGAGAVAQQPDRQQGLRAAGLDDRERGEQDRGGGQRGEDLGITPVGDAVGGGGGADQAVDQGGDPGGAGDRAGQVEPAAAARGLGQHPRGGQRDRGADGHVDEQHPPPGGVGGQQAAADQADRAAGDAD